MANDKVTFESNGTWHRVGDVDALDVAKATETPATPEPEKKGAPAPVDTTAPRPIKSTPPKPGTFNLNSLKSSVASSASPKPAVTMETEGPPKEVTSPAAVREEPVIAEPVEKEVPVTPVAEQPKTTTPVEVQEPVVEAVNEKPAPATVETADEAQKVTRSGFKLSNLSKVEVSTTTEKSKPVDEGKKEVPPAEPVVKETSVTVGKPIEVSAEKNDEPAVEVPPVVVDEPKSSTAHVKQETESAASGTKDVQKMNLTGTTGTSIVEEEEEKVSVAAPTIDEFKSRVDETGIQTFNILPLDRFLELIGSDRTEISKWAIKCISAVSRRPATIFCADFNQKVRFYNYFSVKGGFAGVVIGAEDAITCAKIAVKSGQVEDFYTAIHTEGIVVMDVNGDAVALFSERLRKAVTL